MVKLKRIWCLLFHRWDWEWPWGLDRLDWTYCNACEKYIDLSPAPMKDRSCPCTEHRDS